MLQAEGALAHQRKGRTSWLCELWENSMGAAHQTTAAICIHSLHLPQVPRSLLLSALPSAISRLCSWAIVGLRETPPYAPQPSHLSPALPTWFLHILRRAGKANSCGNKLVCPSYICLWNLEEKKDKGRCVSSFLPMFPDSKLTVCSAATHHIVAFIPFAPSSSFHSTFTPISVLVPPNAPRTFQTPSSDCYRLKTTLVIFNWGFTPPAVLEEEAEQAPAWSKTKNRDLALCPSHTQLRQPVLRNTLHSCHCLPREKR